MTKAMKTRRLGGAVEMIGKRGGARAAKVAKAPPPVLAVNDHAAQHGDYVRDGNRGTINRGGTPVARWSTAKLLTEEQQSAIQFCIKLWDRAGRYSGLTWDPMKIAGMPPSSGMAQQDALDRLSKIKGYVPGRYYDVFENVCRFDEPAGSAGSRLTTNSRQAQEAARQCVCFVADIIFMQERL
jgi:hypothetical protein